MEALLKRTAGNSLGEQSKRRKKEVCPHSEKCYRRNPHHLKEFDHPHLNKFIEMGDSLVIPDNLPQPKNIYLEQIEILKPFIQKNEAKPVKILETQSKSVVDSGASCSGTKRVSNKGKATSYNSDMEPKFKAGYAAGTMLEKLEKAAPYNLFFTTIIKAPETKTQANAITFTDLLCPSLGNLKCSLQINFMIDIDWLLKQYKFRDLHKKPLTIIYGDDWPDMAKFINLFCPNVTYKFLKMKDPFGIHHSKVGIYVYEDLSLRVVISTANLYYEDWNHYNQGLWLSPHCCRLADDRSDTEGESPTGFKSSLLSYLETYNLTHLKPFIEYVKRVDMSAVRVFMTYSAPGKYTAQSSNGSHLFRVGDLLSRHCNLPAKTNPSSEGPLSWGIIAQSSSLGSMGKSAAEWLRGSLLRSLSSHKQNSMQRNSQATLNIVYPSVDNVMTGYFGPESGGCLPYSKATNERQKWLQDYLHQWKASAYGRTRAMPHIKTYCRVSPCMTKLAYFLLTSANMSKSAWGSPFTKDNSTYVRSYEVGVMFLPKFFDEEYFEIQRTLNSNNKNLFPFMIDLPLSTYRADDYPWCN